MPFYDILSTFGNRALHNHATKICTLCRCVYFQLRAPTASHNNPHIYSNFTPWPIMCNRFPETAQHPHHHAKNTNVTPCPLQPIRHTESHTAPLRNTITPQKTLPPQNKDAEKPHRLVLTNFFRPKSTSISAEKECLDGFLPIGKQARMSAKQHKASSRKSLKMPYVIFY